MKPCRKCGSSERYPSGGCKPCQIAYQRVIRGTDPSRYGKPGISPLPGFACRKCGSTNRAKPSKRNGFGRCRDCSERIKREREPFYPRHAGSWRQFGWASIAEMKLGILTARRGTRCQACETETPGGRWKRFVADHSDKRLGGTGLFRGVLCAPCNLIVGFHERHGYRLPPWIAEYLKLQNLREVA